MQKFVEGKFSPTEFARYDLTRGVRTALPFLSGYVYAISDDGSRGVTFTTRVVGKDAPAHVTLWNLTTGKPLADHIVGPESIGPRAFSPDLRVALMGYHDPKTLRWGVAELDLETGETRGLYLTASRAQTSNQVTARCAGSRIVVAVGASVSVFDRGSAEPRRTLLLREECRSLSVSPDARLLLAREGAQNFNFGRTREKSTGHVWDLNTGELVAEVPHGAELAENAVLDAVSNGIDAIDWPAAAPFAETQPLKPRPFGPDADRYDVPSVGTDGNPMLTVTSKDDNRTLAYAFYDENGRSLGRYPAQGDLPKDASVNLAGPFLIDRRKGAVDLLRLPDLRLARTLRDPHPGDGNGWDATPDRAHVAHADPSGTLRVWGGGPEPAMILATGMTYVLTDAKGKRTVYPPDVALSPDGSRVAAADGHGLRVWDVSTRRLIFGAAKGYEEEEYDPVEPRRPPCPVRHGEEARRARPRHRRAADRPAARHLRIPVRALARRAARRERDRCPIHPNGLAPVRIGRGAGSDPDEQCGNRVVLHFRHGVELFPRWTPAPGAVPQRKAADVRRRPRSPSAARPWLTRPFGLAGG